MYTETIRSSSRVNLERLVSQIPLDWPEDKFILCGSAALAVRDIRDVNDLDLLVHESLWVYRSQIPGNVLEKEDYRPIEGDGQKEQNLIRLDTGFDIFDSLPRHIASFSRVLEYADTYEVGGRKVKVLCLRHVLAVKAMAMTVPIRTKDWVDMSSLQQRIAMEESTPDKPPQWFKVASEQKKARDIQLASARDREHANEDATDRAFDFGA